MKNIISLLFVLTTLTAVAQNQLLTDSRQYGKPIDPTASDMLKGSPYLLEGWSSGVALTAQNKLQVKLPKMRYNVLTEQIEFESDNKVLFLESGIFNSFKIFSGKDTLYFKNQITGSKKFSKDAYAQVLFEGNHLWIKKTIKSLINDPDAPYGSTKMKLIQNEQSYFLIKASGEAISLKLNKRALIKTFGEVPDLSSYLDATPGSWESDDYLQTIFSWIDKKL